MTSLKVKTQLFLASLVIISSEYNDVILEGLELTQEEKSSIGYFLFQYFPSQENLAKVKPPFNHLSVMKMDFADFLEPILQKGVFDINTDYVSKWTEEGRKSNIGHLLFKIQPPGKTIKMATIFTNEEAINEKKVLQMDKILDLTKADFEERLEDYLDFNFPKKNKKVFEIFFDEAIVDFSYTFKLEYGQRIGYIPIDIYFDADNLIVNPGAKERSSDIFDSKKIQLSLLKGKNISAVLDKSLKNKNNILKLKCTCLAEIIFDDSEGSENIIKWKFKRPQDEGIKVANIRPFRMSFGYFVEDNKPERLRRLWDIWNDTLRVLEWKNLQHITCERMKKAVKIMNNHFKNWNADEEKEFPLKNPEASAKSLKVAILTLFVIIGVSISIFSYSIWRKWTKKRSMLINNV